MNKFYKILQVIMIIACGLNIYAIVKSDKGFLDEENTQFVLAFSAGIVAILIISVLNVWGKIKKD